MTDTKSYVYDNTEVVQTGRQAVKNLASGKTDTLIEITPKSLSFGAWKKWVRVKDLYEVVVDDEKVSVN